MLLSIVYNSQFVCYQLEQMKKIANETKNSLALGLRYFSKNALHHDDINKKLSKDVKNESKICYKVTLK